MQKNLVIVESPAKAKTIEKFLGKDFKVMSSYGHIRDLKKKEFSIDIETFNPIYEIPSDKKDLVKSLRENAKEAETVWLASDEDREGEAISWHLSEVLKLPQESTKRIVFHEITKPAILEAIENPRTIDLNLVKAQQARRVMDRIVGFKVSPILWKKVKPSLSAGRVQSVAVRLIVEREREINSFVTEAAFRVSALFALEDGTELRAELNHKFNTQQEAESFLKEAQIADFIIGDVSTKPIRKSPAPPFTTSTMQQEAARKLNLTVQQTMLIAQHLYEHGLITYMRTDSVNLSKLCLAQSAQVIEESMGKNYVHVRQFATQTKGAQEAHEAIRPTDMSVSEIEGSVQERRLYDLIWKRTLASQMAEAQLERTTVTINMDNNKENLFQAYGAQIKFDGFLKVYREDTDEEKKAFEELKTQYEPVCKKIKEIKDVAIIMLSARNQEEDKLFFFDLGVDDYVTKPFSPKELMARIKAVCERRNVKSSQKYVFEGLVVDVDGRTVTIDGEKANLTPKEFELLVYLIENRNIALDREKILNSVWNYDFYGDDRTVDTHIKMLRNDLGRYRDYIVTVRGMGYKFEA